MGSRAKCNGGGGGGGGSGGGEDEVKQLEAELGKTLKEGERILAPTRRPDGTLRKPIRIRAGYVPQDEVAIYQSKGSLWRKEMESLQDVPPGYDPVTEAKPKTKAAKRNERKKEKRQQAALEKGKDSEGNDVSPTDDSYLKEHEEPIASQLNGLSISSSSTNSNPPNSLEDSAPADHAQDIDKKIRALKKKIRLAEAQLQKTGEQGMKPELQEKMAKLEGWREELKILEDKKAESVS
ncbi:OLC1v1002496C1 [Oldenlandia corymbosa var. corymbosa]|uniref:OLC1v1002496C1 n=1 Tax=Oldenlandia corymbosa var. corymbosa TaxID=529605 RepID=A0AAV1D8Y9_OLDCO|nr:OLC1v1002496C1 [Oldenlandia corymbosa var. corymbosa]